MRAIGEQDEETAAGQIGVLQRVFARVGGTNERDGVIDAIEFQRALFGRASGGDGDAEG